MASDVLERVAEPVYRIRDRFVNFYMIDVGKVALVDTGTKKAEPLVRAGLRELGKDVGDVQYVLLTHHHLDHRGTAGVWRRESRASVAVQEADARVVRGEETRRTHGFGAKGRLAAMFVAVFNRLYAVPPFPPDRLLHGGEALDLLGLRVEAVPTPGHTLGSCAFWLPAEGVLFAGDAANTTGGKPTMPLLAEDRAAAEASFRRLREMRPAVLCPGHGDPIRSA